MSEYMNALGPETSPELHEAMQQILETFGGGDGGVSFVHLLSAVRELDRQHREGNEAAGKCLLPLLQTSKLIKCVNRTMVVE